MNRKKILVITVLMTVFFLAAFHVKLNSSDSRLIDVSLDNINALAQESNNPPNCYQAKGFCVINDMKYDYLEFDL